jgi:hypothetical protein
MIGRPCKPDPDLNWLWRTLLPDTPVPACDSGQKHDPASEMLEEGGARPREPVERSWLHKLLPVRSQSELKTDRKS